MCRGGAGSRLDSARPTRSLPAHRRAVAENETRSKEHDEGWWEGGERPFGAEVGSRGATRSVVNASDELTSPPQRKFLKNVVLVDKDTDGPVDGDGNNESADLGEAASIRGSPQKQRVNASDSQLKGGDGERETSGT